MDLDIEETIPDAKVEQAVFGEEVRAFLEDDRIGRFLVNKAALEVEDAMLELKTVDPDDPKAIRRIQARIQVAESVVSWLAGAIDDGQRAREQLELEEAENRT